MNFSFKNQNIALNKQSERNIWAKETMNIQNNNKSIISPTTKPLRPYKKKSENVDLKALSNFHHEEINRVIEEMHKTEIKERSNYIPLLSSYITSIENIFISIKQRIPQYNNLILQILLKIRKTMDNIKLENPAKPLKCDILSEKFTQTIDSPGDSIKDDTSDLVFIKDLLDQIKSLKSPESSDKLVEIYNTLNQSNLKNMPDLSEIIVLAESSPINEELYQQIKAVHREIASNFRNRLSNIEHKYKETQTYEKLLAPEQYEAMLSTFFEEKNSEISRLRKVISQLCGDIKKFKSIATTENKKLTELQRKYSNVQFRKNTNNEVDDDTVSIDFNKFKENPLVDTLENPSYKSILEKTNEKYRLLKKKLSLIEFD